MDRLARNAMLAKQAGMSYGKWKAMQETIQIKKKESPEEDMKVCPYCGKKFKPKSKKQKYCDITCQQQHWYENNKERLNERIREKRKEAVVNG